MVSVKSSAPLPKEKLFDAVKELGAITLKVPVRIGDIVVKNILDTGVDIVATKNIP